MLQGLLIEKLSQKYRKDWEILWKKYLLFYETSRKPDLYDFTFSRLISESEDCEGFIAFVDGEAVGIAHCIYHMHLWHKNKVCYLQDLFVEENSRKKGVAKKLLFSVYEKADKLGLENVYWLTQDFNTPARNFYDKYAKLTPFIKYSKK